MTAESSLTFPIMGSGVGLPSEAPEPERPAPRKRGPKKRRFTKTQEELLRYIAAETVLHGGITCTKKHLAEVTGRNVKTVDRCLAGLKREGVVAVEMRFSETGAQEASMYRAVSEHL